MSLRYMKRIDCTEMLERRAKLHATYPSMSETKL